MAVRRAGWAASCGSAVTSGGGFLPGQADQVLVGEQPEQAQAGVAAGLGGAEDVALAALLEVEPGQLEAVQGGGHRVQPLP